MNEREERILSLIKGGITMGALYAQMGTVYEWWMFARMVQEGMVYISEDMAYLTGKGAMVLEGTYSGL